MARHALKTLMLATAAVCAASSALAQEILPPKVYSTTPGGINVADASFVHSVGDLVIGPLQLERFHLSGVKKPNNPLIGTNMSHNFDIYVAANLRQATGMPWHLPNRYRPVVHIGSSASGVYAQTTSNLATINDWNLDAQRSGILSWSGAASWTGGHYVYTDRDGAIYTFTESVSAAGVPFQSQRVSSIAFPDGRIQTFTYNSSQQLKLVSDSSGYAIVFDYNGAGDVSAACGFNLSQSYVTASSTCSAATPKVSYGYDGSGNLTSVTDVMGQVTTYPGNGFYGITCVQPPGYSSCKASINYGYNVSDANAVQTMADGSVWTVLGSRPDIINDPDSPVDPIDGGNSGSVTDPAGKVTSFTFTKSTPYAVTDPDGKTTAYRFEGGMEFDYMGTPYSEGTLLKEVTLPEGNQYEAEYNGPARSITKETLVAKPGSGLANRVKEYGYNALSCTAQNCTKPIWIKDPKGNQTDYTYASWGGLTSEMQPAPSSGAARPLKLVTYVQKSAYIKNSGGTLVSTGLPIWLPDTETLCQTYAGSSTATCDTGAPITVTSYEYGANGTADNLLLRGKVVTSGGVSLRTCYGYDARGRKIWETSPRGTSSAVCS
ncbi:MAG: hypothetical protein KF730_05575 [Sphingomonas sp.]|uniref:hypothetical protein n=1 Tax=Sphingomonas sp. TaxID=28214 RepID=UPI0025E03D7E|nr:hypothetical protein [Sphingomonas sp.]MBX3564031.1 hypothetical protein [Sphingomonas sp.]